MEAKGIRLPARVSRRAVLRGCVAGTVLAGCWHFGYIFLGSNFYPVLPGEIYRSAQLDGPTLERLIRKNHIRTVLNLRGCCDPAPWYLDECRAAGSLDVSLEDVGVSAGRLPPVYAVRQFVEILDHSERPLVIHCNKGVDRTGMVSAMALLLYTNASLDEARRQLSAFHGHLAFGRTGHMDHFFDLYAEWLSANGLEHSSARFRRWAVREYCPGECLCSIEVLEPTPIRLPRGRSSAIRVRCTNTSVKPWILRPEESAGIHAQYKLFNAADQYIADGRAGLFHARVEPGKAIDLTLALPSLTEPGRYLLRVDMTDEQHGSFFQFGSEPLFQEIEVE
jgi:hypothetical protein